MDKLLKILIKISKIYSKNYMDNAVCLYSFDKIVLKWNFFFFFIIHGKKMYEWKERRFSTYIFPMKTLKTMDSSLNPNTSDNLRYTWRSKKTRNKQKVEKSSVFKIINLSFISLFTISFFQHKIYLIKSFFRLKYQQYLILYTSCQIN